MRDRTIVIAFFGIFVAVGLFVSGTILGLVLGLVALLLVGIFVSLEPRKDYNGEGPLAPEALSVYR
ncbi:MAG TPA: hypothetical protein VEL71_06365 [Candidatus Dormibacteraeota bacterium]|nr:hypothetical protein [Candidatus Dormibacteraeota bacterium]